MEPRQHVPLSAFCCQNPQCPDVGKKGLGNLSQHHWVDRQTQRIRNLRCRTCKKEFSERKGTPSMKTLVKLHARLPQRPCGHPSIRAWRATSTHCTSRTRGSLTFNQGPYAQEVTRAAGVFDPVSGRWCSCQWRRSVHTVQASSASFLAVAVRASFGPSRALSLS